MFFFHDTAPTEIYTLSLHDALPIFREAIMRNPENVEAHCNLALVLMQGGAFREGWSKYEWRMRSKHWGKIAVDRKSTRLNSSHITISYAVFCLKKKKSGTQLILTNV